MLPHPKGMGYPKNRYYMKKEWKPSKLSQKEFYAWSVLVPRIEEVLEADICSEYKCVLIKYVIQEARNRK